MHILPVRQQYKVQINTVDCLLKRNERFMYCNFLTKQLVRAYETVASYFWPWAAAFGRLVWRNAAQIYGNIYIFAIDVGLRELVKLIHSMWCETKGQVCYYSYFLPSFTE